MHYTVLGVAHSSRTTVRSGSLFDGQELGYRHFDFDLPAGKLGRRRCTLDFVLEESLDHKADSPSTSMVWCSSTGLCRNQPPSPHDVVDMSKGYRSDTAVVISQPCHRQFASRLIYCLSDEPPCFAIKYSPSGVHSNPNSITVDWIFYLSTLCFKLP